MQFPIKTSSGPRRGVAMSKSTVGDVGRSYRIFATVENHQAKH